MIQVNMFEAKTDLSKLVRLLETREEDVIYLARNNKIVAEITLHQEVPATKRIGAAGIKRWKPCSEAKYEAPFGYAHSAVDFGR